MFISAVHVYLDVLLSYLTLLHDVANVVGCWMVGWLIRRKSRVTLILWFLCDSRVALMFNCYKTVIYL